MNTPTQLQHPPIDRARDWVRNNLFSGVTNSILTIVVALVVGYVLFAALRFVLIDAEWAVVSVNKRLIFLGRYS
jgi:hypothetical protein